MKRGKLWLALLGLLWVGPAKAAPVSPKISHISLLRSEETLRFLGWKSKWEWEGALRALRGLGLQVDVLTPAQIGHCHSSIIVLANARNLDIPSLNALRAYRRRGGHVFATYQTSYRQADNASWTPNNFGLADLFGVSFSRWAGSAPESHKLSYRLPPWIFRYRPPTARPSVEAEDGHYKTPAEASREHAAEIELAPASPRFAEGEMELARHLSMRFEPAPNTQVLATWDEPDAPAAILENRGVIYCGEDLFTPENSRSLDILRLIARLLKRLDPSLRLRVPAQALAHISPRPPFLVFPELPERGSGPIPLGFHAVRIGTGAFPGTIRIQAPEGVVSFQMAKHARSTQSELSLYPVAEGVALTRVAKAPSPSCLISGKTYLNVWLENPNGTARCVTYRGSLEVRGGPSGLSLVNILPLDQYLAGVVSSEVPANFESEALKAMAVVARTFTLSHLGRHAREGFDLCSEVHCQVYRGLAQEMESTTQAVLETVNQILVYSRQPADTAFHATCGGEGASASDVWPKRVVVPYLVGLADLPGEPAGGGPPTPSNVTDLTVEDNLRRLLTQPSNAYCSGAGRFRWQEKYTQEQFQAQLERSLPVLLGAEFKGLGKFVAATVAQRDASGRIARLVLRGTEGSYAVGGDAVRWLTSAGRVGGAGSLNSSLFVVEMGDDGSVHLTGGGWGHGVGLCQEGAQGRAKAGQTYDQIVQHYYPGCRLQNTLGGPSPSRVEGKGPRRSRP